MVPAVVIDVIFEPRRSGIRVRMSGRGASASVAVANRQEAIDAVDAWLAEHREDGDLLQVRCGSRLVGMTADPATAAQLVERALRNL